MTVAAAALLGLVSSAHCVAMCGPLAMLMTGPRGDGTWGQLRRAFLYHAGRTATYVALGLGAGLLGYATAWTGAGRALAIAGGAVLVIAALVPRLLGRQAGVHLRLMPLVARASAGARRVQVRAPRLGTLALGMANGLLPCGMVYAALVLALTAGSVAEAGVAMAAFGAATAPALVAAAMAASAVPQVWRERLAPAAPLALAGVGVLLVVRGFTMSCH